MSWLIVALLAVLLVILGVVVYDNRATRQALRNHEGTITGLRLDLDAARERIEQLQTYLSDHENWQTDPPRPVPPEVADRSVRDRWSPADAPATESSPRP